MSYLDAILGRSVTVKTVDGTHNLNIAPGTQPGAVMKIDRKGIPKLGNPNVRGDHYVTVEVRIPTRLTGEERWLVEHLDELGTLFYVSIVPRCTPCTTCNLRRDVRWRSKVILSSTIT